MQNHFFRIKVCPLYCGVCTGTRSSRGPRTRNLYSFWATSTVHTHTFLHRAQHFFFSNPPKKVSHSRREAHAFARRKWLTFFIYSFPADPFRLWCRKVPKYFLFAQVYGMVEQSGFLLYNFPFPCASVGYPKAVFAPSLTVPKVVFAPSPICSECLSRLISWLASPVHLALNPMRGPSLSVWL